MGKITKLLSTVKENIQKEFDSEEAAQKWIDDNSLEGATISKEGDKYIVTVKSKDNGNGKNGNGKNGNGDKDKDEE